jgi:hypothetical protein
MRREAAALREEVKLHLGYRWFCRLELDDKIPDHSTFSVNRHGRFRDSDILRQVFEAVVRACMDDAQQCLCRFSHSQDDAPLILREPLPLRHFDHAKHAVHRRSDFLDRVAAIEIGTTSRGYQMAGSDPEKWVPDTKETADHSLPYIVARAMFDGGLDNDSYAPEKLRDLRILALRKITVKVDPAFATLTINVPPSRLTATLDDGHALRASSIACRVSQDGR